MADGSAFDPKVVKPPEIAPPPPPTKGPPRQKDDRPEKPKEFRWGARWAEEGMFVWLPWNMEKRSAVRCKVTMAAGMHVRVVNERYGVNKLVHLDSVILEKGDPHGYG